jgi:bile acid:Na+ symporter, BASS family
VRAMKAELDGFGVVMYFIFAVAAMDGVTAAALADPALVATFLAVAFALALAGLALGLVMLRFVPPTDRFVLGYATAQRNMGLLVAALGAGVPPTAFLFFALAQFPIYLMPWLLKPLARKIAAEED